MANVILAPSTRKINSQNVPDSLALAAEWYAKRGYYVFPCWPGTKKPATPNGLDDATTDLAQVRAWWKENPNYNVAINCGLSGLLVVDRDLYKTNATGVRLRTVETVTVNTARGGLHDYYKMPIGKTYGNSRGNLPAWLDIRGFGGYVMAPPSVFVEDGKRLPYSFAEGHNPAEIDVADLPADIAVVLDAAQAARDTVPVIFTDGPVAVPDLAQWPLPDAILELIHEGVAKGGRSEADQKVITALIYAGATDDDIRAVFTHFAIGGKYQDRGDKYLARSIGRARVWVEEHPVEQTTPEAAAQYGALRAWGQSAEFTERLIEDGITRPAEYQKTFIALLNYASAKRAPRVKISSRQLALMTSFDHMTAKRHLAMFGSGITTKHKDGTVSHRPGLNLVTITDDPEKRGKWVDFSEVLRSVTPLSPTVRECNTSQQVVNEHLADEAFVPYQHRFAVKLWPDTEILRHGLSAAALFIAATLSEHGELTRSTICQLTGLKPYTVGRIMRRMEEMGLLIVWKGKPYRYDLHPNFEEVLDDLRPMLPSHFLGQKRAGDTMRARADYCARLLNGRMPLDDNERVKVKARQEKYEEAENNYLVAMIEAGMNPFAKLVDTPTKRTIVSDDLSAMSLEELAQRDPDKAIKLPRPYMKVDHGEQWVSIYRPIYEAYQDLAPLPHAERLRMLGYAEYSNSEVQAALHNAARVGRATRQFIGVESLAA